MSGVIITAEMKEDAKKYAKEIDTEPLLASIGVKPSRQDLCGGGRE